MTHMKLNSHLPSTLYSTRFKEPAAKSTGDTQNNLHQQVSPSHDLRPANISSRRPSPSPLQKLFARERQSGASAPLSSEPIFSSPHLQQKFTEIEKHVIEIFKKGLSTPERDTFPTFMFKKLMEDGVNYGLEALEEALSQEIPLLLENATDQKSRQALQNSISRVKARLQAAVEETSLSAGWKAFQPKESKLTWEPPDGPLLIKRGLTLQQVKLERAEIASGGFGSVSIFKNENGDKLIGKISSNNMQNADGSIKDDLAHELKGYQTIYRAVGNHPNLVNVYGIVRMPKNREMKHRLLNAFGLAQAQKNSKMKRVLLMDMVPGKDGEIPGPTGEKTFDALRKCWNDGKISSEQYWGAMQFIGRRLLDVTEHLGKAGIVHNDIKPQNFLVNEETGEPVVIDLGIWTKSREKHITGTKGFMAWEVATRKFSDELSDVFTVGASLLRGIEGNNENRSPNEGLFQQAAFRDDEGNMVREPGTYSAETDYTKFMSSILKRKRGRRVNSKKAKNLAFLNDSMLSDDAAKKVIKDAIAADREEEKRPEEEQWKKVEPQVHVSEERRERTQGLINALFMKPTLSGYAALWNESKTYPELKELLDRSEVRNLQGAIEQDAKENADLLIENTPWFDEAREIAETVKIKSGVDKNGKRLKPEKENIDQDYESSANQIKDVRYSRKDELKSYADLAKQFLRAAWTLKKIGDGELIEKIEQVRERDAVARRMVKIFDADLSKPEESNVQERARESRNLLTDVLLGHREKTENRREIALQVESFLKEGKWPNK